MRKHCIGFARFVRHPNIEETDSLQTRTMNTFSYCTGTFAGLFLLILGPLGKGPCRAAEAAEKNGVEADEGVTIELSPFVVGTQRDTGFVAASALAGGRLATDLKDTPVAYSVINRDFIEALGLTDLNAAADWAPNTMKFYDGAGGGDSFNITAPITTRGVGNISQLRQRNFFVYYGPMDSYSIERYDFGRGPNQVLFGNGTFGGTQVSMTKRPRFDRARDSLELSMGSWSNFRTVLDLNQPLGKNLAIRVAAVWSDRDGWRLGEHEKTKAVFATATYRLTKTTELRIEGEIGQQARRIPFAHINEGFAGWDGATVFNGPVNTLPASANALGYSRRASNYLVYDPTSGVNAVMNYQNDPFTLGGGSSATTPIAGFVQVGTQSLGSSGAPMLHALDVPAGRFDRAQANSTFRLPSEDFTIAPPVPTLVQNFKDLQLTLSQQLGDSLFFEVAGDVNKVYNTRNLIEGSSSTPATFIDINRLLPNGAPNPHFLVPYSDLQYRLVQNHSNAQSVRAAVAYIKDAGKWGNYSFNLMGGLTHRKGNVRNQYLQTRTQADHRQWGSGGLGIRMRQYWNEPPVYAVPNASIAFVDPITPANSGTIQPAFTQDVTTFNNANEVNEDYNYLLTAMNAKFFKGRWVLLAALRVDKSQQVVRYTKVQGDYPVDWDGKTVLFRPDAPADWTTLTYIPKNAAGVATGPGVAASARPRVGNNAANDPQPQYANDRFQDDFNPPIVKSSRQTPSVGSVVHVTSWVSLSGNYAKAFAFNSSAAPDPNNHLLPAVQGDGWDTSARFTLIHGKLYFTAGYYSNTEFGNYIDPSSVTNQINNLYTSNAVGDLSADGRNIRTAGNISGVVRDTRNRLAEGYEFEMVANLTKGLRLTANYALPKVWQKEFAPVTRAYVAQRTELFKQILADAGGMIDPTTGRAVANPAIPAATAIDQVRAVNGYNGIYDNQKDQLADRQIADFQPILNAFADYTFQTGRLKGFRLGAGINYRGHKVVGYRGAETIVDPANPLVSIDNPAVDGRDPVWAPSYYTVTATAGYRWKLHGNRELSLNLRLSNLMNNRAVVYTDGTVLRPLKGDYTSPARESVPSSFAYLQPFSFSLTATVKM